MPIANAKQGYHTPGDTAEHVIHAGPCILYGVYPELVTTGTITIRNTATAAAGTVASLSAIGLPQAGKSFGGGVGMLFDTGLTVQLSVATDLSTLVWEAC